jgi:hypothetical protein
MSGIKSPKFILTSFIIFYLLYVGIVNLQDPTGGRRRYNKDPNMGDINIDEMRGPGGMGMGPGGMGMGPGGMGGMGGMGPGGMGPGGMGPGGMGPGGMGPGGRRRGGPMGGMNGQPDQQTFPTDNTNPTVGRC